MSRTNTRWLAIAVLACGLLALGPCAALLNTLQALRAALTIVDALA